MVPDEDLAKLKKKILTKKKKLQKITSPKSSAVMTDSDSTVILSQPLFSQDSPVDTPSYSLEYFNFLNPTDKSILLLQYHCDRLWFLCQSDNEVLKFGYLHDQIVSYIWESTVDSTLKYTNASFTVEADVVNLIIISSSCRDKCVPVFVLDVFLLSHDAVHISSEKAFIPLPLCAITQCSGLSDQVDLHVFKSTIFLLICDLDYLYVYDKSANLKAEFSLACPSLPDASISQLLPTWIGDDSFLLCVKSSGSMLSLRLFEAARLAVTHFVDLGFLFGSPCTCLLSRLDCSFLLVCVCTLSKEMFLNVVVFNKASCRSLQIPFTGSDPGATFQLIAFSPDSIIITATSPNQTQLDYWFLADLMKDPTNCANNVHHESLNEGRSLLVCLKRPFPTLLRGPLDRRKELVLL